MEEYQRVLLGCIRRLLGDSPLSFVSDADERIELTVYGDEACYYVNAVHLDERVTMPTVQTIAL